MVPCISGIQGTCILFELYRLSVQKIRNPIWTEKGKSSLHVFHMNCCTSVLYEYPIFPSPFQCKFCAFAEQRADKAIRSLVELYFNGYGEDYVLHSWELSERRRCRDSRSFTRIYGREVLHTIQEQTYRRNQREEIKGLSLTFTKTSIPYEN